MPRHPDGEYHLQPCARVVSVLLLYGMSYIGIASLFPKLPSKRTLYPCRSLLSNANCDVSRKGHVYGPILSEVPVDLGESPNAVIAQHWSRLCLSGRAHHEQGHHGAGRHLHGGLPLVGRTVVVALLRHRTPVRQPARLVRDVFRQLAQAGQPLVELKPYPAAVITAYEGYVGRCRAP